MTRCPGRGGPAAEVIAAHEEIKASDRRWRGEETTPLARYGGIYDDGERVTEYRNCNACHSTMTRDAGPSPLAVAL